MMIKLDDGNFRREFKKYFNSIEDVKDFFIELEKNSTMELLTVVSNSYNFAKVAHDMGIGFLETYTEATCSEQYINENMTSKIVIGCIAMYIEELKKGETEVVKMGIETKYSIDDDPVDSWDEYFFNIARQTARNSKCLSRKIGAILVRDKSIISTGYNGPPRGIPRCDERWGVDPTFDGHTLNTGMKGVCPRKVLGFKSGEGMEICIASHGEESSIVNCARMGTCAMNSKMYLTCGIPCSKCAIKIINAGVEEVIVTKLTYYDKPSQYLFENSTVKIRVYDFIK